MERLDRERPDPAKLHFVPPYERPESARVRRLVLAVGLYEAVHIVVNVVALVGLDDGPLAFPAYPPPSGWTAQALHFLKAMAVVDVLLAALFLLFVAGYLKRRLWSIWLGSSVLSASLYAAVVFDVATLASGAWNGHVLSYTVINLAFLPAPILLAYLGKPFFLRGKG